MWGHQGSDNPNHHGLANVVCMDMLWAVGIFFLAIEGAKWAIERMSLVGRTLCDATNSSYKLGGRSGKPQIANSFHRT